MSQLRKGALLSYINIFLTSATGILITPYIISNIGNSEYGLYILVGGIIGYISSLDLGLNNTVIRYVSKYNAENNKLGESLFLSTIMMIYIFILFLILIAGIFLYYNIESIFSKSLTSIEVQNFKIMFSILMFNLAIALPGGVFTAICDAYQRFSIPRGLSILKYSSKALLVLLIINKDSNAIVIVWIDTILNLIVISLSFFYVYFHLGIKINLTFKLDKKLIKELFSYSIWIFVAVLSYKLQWNIGQTILGVNLNSQIVAVFGVGVMLASYYTVFASVINSMLLPKSTHMVVNNSKPDEYTSFVIDVGRINFLLLLPIISGFFLFGKLFLKLWVGDDFADSWLIALTIMSVMTLPLVSGIGNYILEAQKKNRFKAVLNVITLSLSSIVGYFLSKRYGMYGMLIPITVAILINNILLIRYYKKIFSFNIILFFKEVFVKSFFVNGILIFTSYIVYNNIEPASWFGLVLSSIIYFILYISVNYIFVLNDKEKILIKLKSSNIK
jgi:O-antigen/teichoic acid export membrane protein